ncbi:MAG: CBS and ACT domain-containing protein [Gemmatimonadota bacterium]
MFVGRRMTRNVVTVSPDDTLERAAALMKEHRVHHLPVVSGNELAGIVTDTDIRNAAVGGPGPPGSRTVGEIMTRDPVTVGARDMVEDALLILHRRRFGALPVVEGKKLVGIISKTDVLAAFIDTLDIEGVGVRLEVLLPADTGELQRLVRAIGETGAALNSLVVSPFRGQFIAFLRMQTIDVAAVRGRLRGAGFVLPDLSDFLD